MDIGVPKEVKNQEFRVGLTPSSVSYLSKQGHRVFVEKSLGSEIGFSDKSYADSGAIICEDPEDLYSKSTLIIKVKEPVENEIPLIRDDHILFTFLHLAGNPEIASKLKDTGVTAIAYETLTSDDGTLPLLSPMSEIAGQISIVVGNYHLLKPYGGKGVLANKIDNIEPRKITILGAGVAGSNAIKGAIKLGADVTVLDLSQEKLDQLDMQYQNNILTKLSNDHNILDAICESDIIIGSVYVTGKKAPIVITKDMLKKIQPGTVLVDISIDQGGCFESSKPTTHDEPTYAIDEILHYCVSNMPGAVPLTASQALNYASLPYVNKLATIGINKIFEDDIHFANGLNLSNGEFTHPSVIETLS